MQNEKPLIFISWSGPASGSVGTLLHDFIGNVIQSVDVFVSNDTEKGRPWFDEIKVKLEASVYGIACITIENKREPWLLFESGALLSKGISPVLIDLKPGDLTPPLSLLQCTKLDNADMRKLLETINNLTGSHLDNEKLNNSFNAHWSKFETELRKLQDKMVSQNAKIKGVDDRVNEATNIEDKFDERAKKLEAEFGRQIKNANINKSIPIVSELNRRISKMINSIAPLRYTPVDDNEQQKTTANNDIALFSEYLDTNRFFIDAQIMSYAEEIKNEVNRYMNSLNIFFQRGSKEWGNEVKNSMNIGNEVFDNKIPELQRNIEERFRSIYDYDAPPTTEL